MFPRIIFSDFDGTLTHGSSLGSVFFEIIGEIKEKGSDLIIVTGRSLSWAHFFLTHVDVQVVISEGGGMLSLSDGDGKIEDVCLVSDKELEELDNCVLEVKKQFPNINLSVDSFGRKTDRAIELYDLENDLSKLQALLDSMNVQHSCSSVHLNFWKGDLSKYKAVKYYLENFAKGIDERDCLYFGDSTNDESMFRFFPKTIGVSNISSVLKDLTFPPSIILSGHRNKGPDGVLNYLRSLSR